MLFSIFIRGIVLTNNPIPVTESKFDLNTYSSTVNRWGEHMLSFCKPRSVENNIKPILVEIIQNELAKQK